MFWLYESSPKTFFPSEKKTSYTYPKTRNFSNEKFLILACKKTIFYPKKKFLALTSKKPRFSTQRNYLLYLPKKEIQMKKLLLYFTNLCFSSSRIFLYRLRPYCCFFSFSSLEILSFTRLFGSLSLLSW